MFQRHPRMQHIKREALGFEPYFILAWGFYGTGQDRLGLDQCYAWGQDQYFQTA